LVSDKQSFYVVDVLFVTRKLVSLRWQSYALICTWPRWFWDKSF